MQMAQDLEAARCSGALPEHQGGRLTCVVVLAIHVAICTARVRRKKKPVHRLVHTGPQHGPGLQKSRAKRGCGRAQVSECPQHPHHRREQTAPQQPQPACIKAAIVAIVSRPPICSTRASTCSSCLSIQAGTCLHANICHGQMESAIGANWQGLCSRNAEGSNGKCQ